MMHASAPLVEARDLTRVFDVSKPWLNRVIEGVAHGNWLNKSDEPGGPGVVTAVINFFRIGPVWLMRHHPLYFILFTLWFLTIWAIFGGAIARIAAIHVARDEKLSVRAAIAFSLRRWSDYSCHRAAHSGVCRGRSRCRAARPWAPIQAPCSCR